MKTLRFNRELMRKAYLSYFPILKRDKRKLESLLVRGELLARNPLFIQDLEKWERLRANPQHRTSQWNKEKTVFIKRWHVDPYTGMYWNAGNCAVQRAFDGESWDPEIEGVAQVIGNDRRKATISIEVDLRFPKRRIMSTIENLIDEWQESLRDEVVSALSSRDAGSFPSWFNAGDSFEKLPMLQPVKIGKTRTDPDDYLKALSVWDLREAQKKTWSEIQKELKLNNLQAGRNWHRKACELIKSGIPTLAPFPKK
jgi:hypothetical protein